MGADKGLGYVIYISESNIETSQLFAALFFISFLGIFLYRIIEIIEKQVYKQYFKEKIL